MSSEQQFAMSAHNIMFITDNQVDAKKIEKAFMDIGSMECLLFTCATVDQAVQYIDQRQIAMEVVILDLHIKGGQSPDTLCADVIERIPGVPVMALDVKSEDSTVQAAAIRASGAADYMDRTQFDELVFRIKKLINNKA